MKGFQLPKILLSLKNVPFKLKKSFSRLYFDLERLSSRVDPISGYLKNKRQNTVDATDTCRFKGIDGS